MKPGDESVVLGRVRVVVWEAYTDGMALVDVVHARVPDVDANLKNLVPGMRFTCSHEAILLDEPVAPHS